MREESRRQKRRLRHQEAMFKKRKLFTKIKKTDNSTNLPKPRGRPCQNKDTDIQQENTMCLGDHTSLQTGNMTIVIKRKRGRPKKGDTNKEKWLQNTAKCTGPCKKDNAGLPLQPRGELLQCDQGQTGDMANSLNTQTKPTAKKRKRLPKNNSAKKQHIAKEHPFNYDKTSVDIIMAEPNKKKVKDNISIQTVKPCISYEELKEKALHETCEVKLIKLENQVNVGIDLLKYV